MSRLWLIVPAAGQGRRMGAECPKQYLDIAGRPVLAHTLARLHEAFPEAALRLCLDPDDTRFSPEWVPFADWQRVAGGRERADSVENALASLADVAADDDLVLVHDVARPCVAVEDLRRLREALTTSPEGGLLAAPVADTMKRADVRGHVVHTVSREGLWHAMTPQGAPYRVLCRAFAHARGAGVVLTDEASALEAWGLAPRLVPGRRDNLKITHPEDLALATRLLAGDPASRRAAGALSDDSLADEARS